MLALAANVARQAAVATRKRQAPGALLELVREEGAVGVTRDQVRSLSFGMAWLECMGFVAVGCFGFVRFGFMVGGLVWARRGGLMWFRLFVVWDGLPWFCLLLA